MNWKDKRINEINKICSARPGAAECFIEEVHGIYESKAKSYADFQEEQEEKREEGEEATSWETQQQPRGRKRDWVVGGVLEAGERAACLRRGGLLRGERPRHRGVLRRDDRTSGRRDRTSGRRRGRGPGRFGRTLDRRRRRAARHVPRVLGRRGRPRRGDQLALRRVPARLRVEQRRRERALRRVQAPLHRLRRNPQNLPHYPPRPLRDLVSPVRHLLFLPPPRLFPHLLQLDDLSAADLPCTHLSLLWWLGDKPWHKGFVLDQGSPLREVPLTILQRTIP